MKKKLLAKHKKEKKGALLSKICRFYGKIPGIWLPVPLPLFLLAFTCRTFLEIKIYKGVKL